MSLVAMATNSASYSAARDDVGGYHLATLLAAARFLYQGTSTNSERGWPSRSAASALHTDLSGVLPARHTQEKTIAVTIQRFSEGPTGMIIRSEISR
jgi:hypothetical protein